MNEDWQWVSTINNYCVSFQTRKNSLTDLRGLPDLIENGRRINNHIGSNRNYFGNNVWFTKRKIVLVIESNNSVHGCTIVWFERKIVVFVMVVVGMFRVAAVMVAKEMGKRLVLFVLMVCYVVMNKNRQLQKLVKFCVCRQKNKKKRYCS